MKLSKGFDEGCPRTGRVRKDQYSGKRSTCSLRPFRGKSKDNRGFVGTRLDHFDLW
jgi:hypothetical protein